MAFDPYFWFIAITAVLAVALSKAGLLGSLGVIGVPLLTLVMPARDAAGMMLPVLLAMDAVAVWSYRRDVDWSVLRLMLPGAMAGTLVGWALWAVVSDAVVLLLVGLITLLFVLDAILGLRARWLARSEGPPRPVWGRFWGLVTGFTSFVSHTGGPPFQIYVLPQKLDPQVYAGTAAVFFAVVNASKLIPYFFLGQLSVTNLSVAAALVPVAIGGVLLGVYLVRRISAAAFYKLAYVLIFVLALKLVWDGATGLGWWG